MGIHDGHREKVRQRFIAAGLDAFAPHEALELLLFYAIPRRDVNPLAHALIERYGSLEAVLTAPIDDLMKVPGMGENAAVLLHLAPQIYRKARIESASQCEALNSVSKVGAYLVERLAGERNEVLYQLCLDRKGKLLACKRLNEGSISYSSMNIRTVVENAVFTGAGAVILAHNHPSGVALPSREDITSTRLVKEALETIDVALADHIIVADGDFVSMAQSGYLER